MTAIFAAKAPGIMRMLMADFGLTVEDAAAILGNLGHESGGFKFLQEIKPLVPGSRGGWGWAQWTGPRRVEFEAYCQRNGLDPASDKANYGYLFVELTGTEAKAIPAVKAAVGLAAKVRAFEAAFERAGVKHYPSREQWAARALAAFAAVKPLTTADIAKKAAKDAALGGGGGLVASGRDPALPDGSMDLTVLLFALAAAVLVFAVSFGIRWWKARKAEVGHRPEPLGDSDNLAESAEVVTVPPPTSDPSPEVRLISRLDQKAQREIVDEAIKSMRALPAIQPKPRAAKKPTAKPKAAKPAKPAAKKRRA